MGELKPGWRRVKFGQVVRLNRETCKDAASEGIERVIGLEHLEPGDLRVRTWADLADGTTFTNRVRPGQVLFGKRRAYQRKVAVADFDAICSGDIYVFETADPKVLVPELLPYICQTDAFFDHAVGTSAGSLSPRTNWSSLAEYEFALPPLEEQRQFHRLLGEGTRAVGACRDLLAAAINLSNAMVVSSLWPDGCDAWLGGKLETATPPSGWSVVRAEALSTALVTKGATPRDDLGVDANSGVPFLKVYNLTFDGSLDFSVNPTWVSMTGHRELRRSTVLPGDVLMNIVGPPLGKVSRIPMAFPESNINQAIVRYRPRSAEIGEWLEAYLLSPLAQNWLLRRAKKTSGQQNLTLEVCRELPVPMPIDVDAALTHIRAARECVRVAQSRLHGAQAAMAAMATELLAGTSGGAEPLEFRTGAHDS